MCCLKANSTFSRRQDPQDGAALELHIPTGPIMSGAEPGDVLGTRYCRSPPAELGLHAYSAALGTLPEDSRSKTWHTAITVSAVIATVPWGAEIELPFSASWGGTTAGLCVIRSPRVWRQHGSESFGRRNYAPSVRVGRWFLQAGDGHGVQGDAKSA
jgi:acetamidase/formamidase